MELPATAIVIAGASGDLAKRKLVPALDALFQQEKLGGAPLIVGTGRTAFTDEQFREHFSISAPFARRLFYHRHLKGLRQFIDTHGTFGRVVFFLSLPPSAYAATAQGIAAEGFGEKAVVIIEKPFGSDTASARTLNRNLASFFDESQIFRIDHYLAKEAVQNMLVFRFANSLFYPVWNSRHVESIQISALEREGVVERGAYFDKAGIIRDMVQNHLLQLLCLLTMEAPLTLRSDDVCCRKIDMLRAMRIDDCHRFQYAGYRSEHGVDPLSTTETYAELQLSINNFRWTGAPVFIRTGKAVHRRGTEIGVRFKTIPRLLFNEAGTIPPNQIVFKIQPAEGIILDIQSKVPGTDNTLSRSTMNFCYRDSFASAIPEAYQRLLYDVLRGDRTLFVNAQESETAWEVVEPVLDRGPVAMYEQGKLPESGLPVRWIDFDEYQGLCG
ncbi:MAG: glucose-6-phosphate dehydrogenase (NADP(+)) [Chitinispirillaceae bacterium]|nr:glucose-6-phosphate dehydrogenase (NADP(+)) [Chitinispirillaceae bacterium]